MGNSLYEYQYIDEYLNRSSLGLMKLDLWIIYKGIQVILKGGGHDSFRKSVKKKPYILFKKI